MISFFSFFLFSTKSNFPMNWILERKQWALPCSMFLQKLLYIPKLSKKWPFSVELDWTKGTLGRCGNIGKVQKIWKFSLKNFFSVPAKYWVWKMNLKNTCSPSFLPAKDPFYYAQLLSDTPKNCLGKTRVFADLTKNIFGRIIFWPNIQALEK